MRGRVIAFGGRVLGKDEPKYLNSPETPLFHKGRELYGLYEARQALRQIRRLLVVEGYMDVVGLRQAGHHLGGRHAGHRHHHGSPANGCSASPQEVVFCFDGDRAGRQAAWRALENALPALREGRQVRFLFLPEGEDPDSPGAQPRAPSAFTARLDHARCRCRTTCSKSWPRRWTWTAWTAGPAWPSWPSRWWRSVPEGVFRALLVRRIAGAVGMDEGA